MASLIKIAERYWVDFLGDRSLLGPTTTLVDSAGLPVDGGSLVTEAGSAAAAVTGAITANSQSVVLPMTKFNGAVIAWWGTFAGITLNFEVCYDGVPTVWIPVSSTPVGGGASVTALSSISAANAYEIYAPGASHVRARASAWTSGTMNIRAVPNVFAADIAPAISGGSLSVTGISGGTNLIADVGLQPRAIAGGLGAPNRLLSAAATVNATLVKASAGRVYKVTGYNAAAALRYLKIYNKATAPTVGTDTPIVTAPLEASKKFDIDFGVYGESFATGIGFGLTTGVADADTGALTAADIVGLNVWYA